MTAQAEDTGRWLIRTLVRKYRILSGLSQREIGDRIFRSDDTIRAWELGRHDIPLSILEPLCRAVGMDEEFVRYMTMVAVARKNGHAVEADMRLNAIFLAAGEEYFGEIFKWDAILIPGPLQNERYHYEFASGTEPGSSQEYIDNGWTFKVERRKALESRQDGPLVQFMFSESTLLQLRQASEELYQEELDYLIESAEVPGWEIRVLTEPVPTGHNTLEIYKRGNSKYAGPPFVYTEGYDSTLCIADPVRVGRYDEFPKTWLKRSIRIEDYPRWRQT
ncbi:Scr1 family TA system antitoxin-like transcriptional regulator [Glycomyces xiaoerkulensis]|uniref:Scr1 family TA system antitoxin-like transcriptional regulator n=1 Tax=Glycomyces xiaoerkulensis TaxID=2038139 RepID=UPI0012FFF983|nr:Scr1 family TA system antitoxin-like transcriptional regulator [Glycomyces xiaoerkulensis]